MLSEKGKYAAATENRRFVWAEIIWPLILNLNDVSFTLQQFQYKRDIVCKEKNISIATPSRGLASLIQKGFILKEDDLYSIHYKLIPYMRVRVTCDYATAIHEVRIN
ncbi:MAG TPA: hypothetical protein OQH54_03625 [Nitrosopumilus sp.]|nr:hypothetical protein [Thermoproteota archaeon]HJJ22790.1 hypothetical protein [Nitrosopumilus sp.]